MTFFQTSRMRYIQSNPHPYCVVATVTTPSDIFMQIKFIRTCLVACSVNTCFSCCQEDSHFQTTKQNQRIFNADACFSVLSGTHNKQTWICTPKPTQTFIY